MTIEGETLEDLSNSVYAVVEPQKTDVWELCRHTFKIHLYLCSRIKALQYPGC